MSALMSTVLCTAPVASVAGQRRVRGASASAHAPLKGSLRGTASLSFGAALGTAPALAVRAVRAPAAVARRSVVAAAGKKVLVVNTNSGGHGTLPALRRAHSRLTPLQHS